MPPTPVATAQVKVGWLDMAAPNWSLPVAVNSCVALEPTAADVGPTAMLVNDWFTVTLTALVVDCPPRSVIVTRKSYVPAAVNVAVVFLAALVPLAEKFTAAGGV